MAILRRTPSGVPPDWGAYHMGVTRRPLTRISFTDKELWRQGVANEAPLGQNIGLYASDVTAPRGPRHDHHARTGRPQGPTPVRRPAGLRAAGVPRRSEDRHGGAGTLPTTPRPRSHLVVGLRRRCGRRRPRPRGRDARGP